jgi:gamma-glutamyltranspeptidase/glutathione hydrolase
MLARGGNAVDAVCAAACAAAVAESPLTGPGAGGFLLARSPDGVATLLDFFVEVPGLGPDGRRLEPSALVAFTVPFGDAEQEFHIGSASVAVPGMVPGVAAAVERLGALSLAEVVEPAIRLARDGVVVTPEIAYLLKILTTMLTHTPEAAAIFAPHGRVLRAGERLVVPDLAETYRDIARTHGETFRGGALGTAMVAHLEQTGGLVTASDLAAYEVIDRAPLQVRHGQVTLITNPPPSSGGVLIAAALREVNAAGVGHDVGFYREIARAGLRANRLRDHRFAADLHEPGFAEGLLGSGRLSRKPTGTTHASAVDEWGGMASLSSSCGSGGGVVVPGTGILLNNMAGEEDLNPGGFGRHTPGTRMSSMMAPTLIVRDGAPVAALGSAGSNRLRSAILQTVVNVVDAGMDLRDAVERPRVHAEGGELEVEGGISEEVVAALASDGHAVHRWGDRNLFFGGVAIAGFGPAGMTGAGDPRRGGAAAGVTASGQIVDL